MSEDSHVETASLRAHAFSKGQLSPGQVLGERFLIVQFLAAGGMGEVYEAADQHLQSKHIALKTLRPEIVGDPAMRTRFEQEVLLAREISHRNVCPTYDLFRMSGPLGTVTFLTMKLLRGESLRTRLMRTGPLPPELALSVVRQIADGLDAAHKAGVIHRDLKPGNVMLEYTDQDVRVSITDFGLSHQYFSDGALGERGQIMGTRGYIAPELFAGRQASPASDIYALGMIAHEIQAGRPPEPQRVLPGNWSSFVQGCLEPDPDRRFRSSLEALDALGLSPATEPVRRGAPIPRRRWLEGAGAAVILLAGAAVFVERNRIEGVLHPLPEKRFVALMSWPPDASTNGAVLRGVLEAVGNRLIRAEAYERNLLILSVRDVLEPQPVKQPNDALSVLGANLVLAGSLAAHDGRYRLDLRLLDAASQSVLRTAAVEGSARESGRLAERAAEAVASLLGIALRPLGYKDEDELATVSPAAYQAFMVADDLSRQPNDAQLDPAIEKYQKVVDMDPHFSLGYARLAAALSRKYLLTRDPGALALAAQNAQLALRYNPKSVSAMLSAAMVDLSSGRTAQALELLQNALRVDPGNPEVLLYVSRAYQDLGQAVAAEESYRSILRERPNNSAAYNDLGWFLYRHGRAREAAEAFQSAATVAPRQALPMTNLGSMYLLLNRRREAIQAFEESLRRYPTELAYLNLGSIYFQDGDYRTALTFYEKARDLQPKEDLPWRNIGDCYAMLGDTKRVLANYEKAAEALGEQLQANPNRGSGWMTIGFYEAKLSRRSEALEALRRADELKATDVASQFTKAQALALLGEEDEALRLVLSCLDQGLSQVEVDLALDLTQVRLDPRYRERVTKLGKPAKPK
jgi:eukaryotic-like serine/threonine-protein kinase